MMRIGLTLTAAFIALGGFATGQPPSGGLDEAMEKATRAAIERVAPSIVQIQTIGGLETLNAGGRGVLVGRGPTTGLIVSPDGYVLSSSFNFANKPSAITVAVPGGKAPLAARVVAEDTTRMLTLLKVEAAGLPVPRIGPKKEIAVGQWVLALGRAWSDGGTSGSPSVSVGIISALDRVWGKAVQTDAKVSPINYGGPLVDLEGRVLGILVPLSPRGDDATAGYEWYDSGIGFAIPMEDVERVLPKLKEGKTLRKGSLGVTLEGEDQLHVPPTVSNVVLDSPAARAGLEQGDQIVEINGKSISRYAQLRHVLGNKYEGDVISLKVRRGDKTIDVAKLELAGPPRSHVLAFLGVLPMRDDPAPGMEVRYVFPKGPADRAGIQAGDRIMQVDGRPFVGRDGLRRLLDLVPPGVQLKITIRRKEGEKTDTVSVRLSEMTSDVPDELPEGSRKQALAVPAPLPGQRPMRPGQPPKKDGKEPKAKEEKKPPPPTGRIARSDPTSGREYWAYVPEDYDPNISYGLLVWLHPAGDAMEENILRIWADLCKQHRFILLAPKAETPGGWLTSEVDFIKSDMRELMRTYTIDRQRVAVHGLGHGAILACFLGFDARDLVRGVAAAGGAAPHPAKENLAGQRLAFFLFAGGRDPALGPIKVFRDQLLEQHIPLRFHEALDHGSGYIQDANVLRELARWLDSLDRL